MKKITLLLVISLFATHYVLGQNDGTSKSESEIKKEVQAIVSATYTDEFLAQVKDEADKRYKLSRKGDSVRVKVKSGAVLVEYSGTFGGIYADKAEVGDKMILLGELDPDSQMLLIPKGNHNAKIYYIKRNFYDPRSKYTVDV